MNLTDLLSNHQDLSKQQKMDEPVDSLLDKTASQLVGKPINRIDGHLKVAGKAPYTADYVLPNMAYGVMVGATIGKGKVKQVHDNTALAVEGVIAVLHDELFLRNPQQGTVKRAPAQTASEVFYHGQPIVLVVGETLEAAQQGAAALQIDYDNDEAHGHFDFEQEKPHSQYINWTNDKNQHMGKPEKTLPNADVSVDVTYTTPSQSNMAMEPHVSLAQWQDGRLILHTANQMIGASHVQLVKALKIKDDEARMLSPYVGGGFGAKLGISSESVMAALAAKQLDRPVLVVMTRAQVMESTVRRSNAEQRIGLGADADGTLHTVIHNSYVSNLPSELFFEPCAISTHFLYQGENREVKYRMVRMNQVLAGSMRAPGEAAGQLALECAMDELAHKLDMCPVKLRIHNEPKENPSTNVPFTARKLVECLQHGAKAFGWDNRPAVASRMEGDWMIGYGMAAASRSDQIRASEARVSLNLAGTDTGVQAVVETDMTDIGTGTYTILAQIAADLLGLPIDCVEVKLGDSSMPTAAGSGGSVGASSSGSAVYLACQALREEIAKLADIPNDILQLANGCVYPQGEHEASLAEKLSEKIADTVTETVSDLSATISTAVSELAERVGLTDSNTQNDGKQNDQATAAPSSTTLKHLLREHAPHGLSAQGSIKPGKNANTHHRAGYGAHFVEVGVHRVTGEVRVRRMLGVFAAGRILNEKTARSQCIGGMTFGVGAALMEQMMYDTRNGRLCNHDFAEYHVPTNADIPDLEVVFLPERDEYANPLHAKGIGELALSGAGAAINNAVFNATGIRVREYPITADKLLAQLPLL